VNPERRKCCVHRMLVADKHDCVEQKMKSRSCLRIVGTPANFTESSTTLQLVLRAHPQRDGLGRCKTLVQNRITLPHSSITTFLLSFQMHPRF
jgi:hypothetical protein